MTVVGRLVGDVVRPVAGLALRPARRAASGVLDVLVPTVVTAVLRRIDVADVLREYVDLDSVVADVDVDAVIDRVDLVSLVNQVLDEIDLPEIIRDSTGSIGSETVRGIRMQGISADEAVDRALDRIRLRQRRGESRVAGPAEPS